MNTSPFIKLFKLGRVKPAYRRIVLHALRVMKKSRDPFHTDRHPIRMAADLEKFIGRDPKLLAKLNIPALVLSIAVHDLWRSMRPTPTVFGEIYGYFAEYKYAADFAVEFLLKNGMHAKRDIKTLSLVRSCIHEHTLANTFHRTSPESRWLYGLDCLDLFSHGRMDELHQYFIILSDSYFFKPILTITKNSLVRTAKRFEFYVDHMKKEAKRREPIVRRHLAQMQKKFHIPGTLPL